MLCFFGDGSFTLLRIAIALVFVASFVEPHGFKDGDFQLVRLTVDVRNLALSLRINNPPKPFPQHCLHRRVLVL